jgi:hypothetical protein
MNSEEFIEKIKLVVRDAAVEGTVENLLDPPGRSVGDRMRLRSEWYNSLSIDEKSYITDVIVEAVDEAVFGLLAVIDGVRVIEKEGTKGRFVLIYRKDEDTVINSPDEAYLHDIYNLSN